MIKFILAYNYKNFIMQGLSVHLTIYMEIRSVTRGVSKGCVRLMYSLRLFHARNEQLGRLYKNLHLKKEGLKYYRLRH